MTNEILSPAQQKGHEIMSRFCKTEEEWKIMMEMLLDFQAKIIAETYNTIEDHE